MKHSDADKRVGRRYFLTTASAAALTGCGVTPNPAQADANARTPGEPEGPFYPRNWGGDVDNNLLRLGDGDRYQPGIALLLKGTILRADGSPAAGARVAIWQTDHQGRYRHPDDAGEAPASAGFQGYGQLVTGSDGGYQFVTIKPVKYGSRPPHVHFRIDDGDTRLTTQMYFPGETKEGGLFGRIASSVWASDRSLLTATVQESADGLTAQFNIRL